MEEALNKVNIKLINFEDKQVDEKAMVLDMQIEFMERWLKLLERNASEKEKYNLVTKHGFVSVQQFNLYIACMDDANNMKWELDDIRHDISSVELAKREKEITEKEVMAENIKNLFYYKMVLRGLGKRDITPYGEDILKMKIR